MTRGGDARPAIASVVLVAAAFFSASASGHAAADEAIPPARFSGEGEVRAAEGHAVLTWELDGDAGGNAADGDLGFELQQSRRRDFSDYRVRYEGPEDAFFVSGLLDGQTWFRVRAVDGDAAGPWSEPLRVEVDYPGSTQVLLLLGVGLVVLAATVGAIAAGYARGRT